MPSRVSPAKISSGTRMMSNTLWSTIPIPSSNAVTTAQIVSTMKRGENGSISVSMVPLQANIRPIMVVDPAASQ